MHSLTTIGITLTNKQHELDNLFNEQFYQLLSSQYNVQVECKTTEFRQGYIISYHIISYQVIYFRRSVQDYKSIGYGKWSHQYKVYKTIQYMGF
jgi:patatin-like phospholipase/acyl hydrolase